MESASFHHCQQEDHQLLVDPSCYGLSWYQNSILNGARNNTNTRDVKQHIYHNIELTPISQDLDLPFTTTSSVSDESFMVHEVQNFAKIKYALCGSSSGLPDFVSSSPRSSVEDLRSKNNHRRIRYNDDNNQHMLFKTLSNGCQMTDDQQMNPIPSSEESISYPNDANSYRGTFSQIFPTVNISNVSQTASVFDINSPALDPFVPPTFNGSFNYQPSSLDAHNLGSHFKDDCLPYDVDRTDSKIAQALIVKNIDAKRPASDYMDAKVHEAIPTKKSKPQSRPTCTSLKVRKEKLGDRISALQQMVSPFGKTDTASVLMEAIGYIKFLQHQVEGSINDGNEETKRDLRSRGLCLVPTSCLSYVTYGGGSVWTTP